MAAGPTNLVIRSASYDAQKGVWVERGYLTVTPAATGVITANQELECAVDQVMKSADGTVTAQPGDTLFVNGQNLKAGEVPKGARITAAGVAKVIIANVTGSNITDSNAQSYDYLLYHYAS